MTRFVLISDTHIGADPMGFQQQKGYPQQAEKLFAALHAWIHQHSGVDFVLHAGDLTNTGAADEIQTASQYSRNALHLPMLLCLGNHDLCQPKNLALWLNYGLEFLPQRQPTYCSFFPDLVLHVMPNHWEARPFFWESEQKPHFRDEQLEMLEANLKINPDLPHILCSHAPVFPIPPAQTGFTEPFHASDPEFTRSVLTLIKRHPHLRLVLCGHNHVNTHVQINETHFVTASSFAETPFEFKVIESNKGEMTMQTVSLQPYLDFAGEYDFDKTYVQGRACDRHF